MLVAACAGMSMLDCRVLSSTEDCKSDGDCAGNERCNADGKFCEKLTEIHIGASLGLTGSVAGFAANTQQALEFATSIINADGGVLGGTLVLDILDDQSDDDLGAQNVQTLVDHGVVAVIGPLRSAQVVKAQSITYAARVLHFSPLGGAGALATSQPAHDRYLFQTITSIRKGSSSAIVAFATAPTAPLPVCTNMAVLHTDDITGQEYKDAIASLLPKHDGCVRTDISFPATLKADYVAEVKTLIAAHPQCAAMIALPPIGAAVVREFAQQKAADTAHDWSQFYWLGTTTLHSPDFLTDARQNKANPTPSYAEGFFGADVDSAPPTAEYGDFAFAWKQTYGSDPPGLAAQAFDALVLAALALEHAASAHDRVKIRDSLYEVSLDGDHVPAFGPGNVGDALRAARRGLRINYQGASGGIEYDDYGVVVDPTLIWHVENGAFSPKPLRYTEAQTAAVDSVKEPIQCP
jgi:neutral amino acid transport system substrate-binding protein